MRFAKALFAALTATAAAKQQLCGTNNPTEDQLEALQDLWRFEQTSSVEHNGNDASFKIRVFWHIIVSDDSVDGYNVTQDALDSQLQVLNERYNRHNISFVDAGSEWLINEKWASIREGDDNDSMDDPTVEMKTTLHAGSYNDLNVYIVEAWEDGGVGQATFPSVYEYDSPDYLNDGIMLLSGSLPNGTLSDFNMGITAVHEVGHWLGLLHPFQGGCDETGADYISDTPAQAFAFNGCPMGMDTCPDQAGLDPIHNYMSYTDDYCRTEFTPKQVARMHLAWYFFRSENYVPRR